MASTSDLLYDGGRQITPVATVADNLFLWTRDQGIDKMVRYGVLLILSAVIATGGIVRDSTATVIGAMIVAPLGTPIIAVALGIITVRPAQVARSTSIVAGSAVAVILVGLTLAFVLTDPINYTTNTQITGRVAPNVTDLLVAIATGLVGAYAQSRDDLSGVLPGVAIAISLVPPLAVVGVCLEGAQWSFAFGALTLFLANAIAMILSGVVVFTIAGYGRFARRDRSETRRALRIVYVLLGLLILPLAYFGIRGVYDATVVAQGSDAAESWLEGSDYSLISASVTNGVLNLRVLGVGPLPDSTAFFDTFDPPFGFTTDVTVTTVNGGTEQLGTAG